MIAKMVFWLSAIAPLGIVAACDGWVDPHTKCKVTETLGRWNEFIDDVDVRDPDRCPFLIDQGRTKSQTYHGVVAARYPGGAGAGDYLETRIFNSLSRNVGIIDAFSSFRGVPPQAEGFISYTAGTGSSATATTGFDEANNVLRDFGSGWLAEADVRLTISYDVTANIAAPSSIIGGSNIQVSANASNHRSPVKYRWWRNGTLMGVTAASFSTTGPAAGSSVTYKLEITDADGDKGADTHVVTALPPFVVTGSAPGYVSAKGTYALTGSANYAASGWRWERSNDGGSTWSLWASTQNTTFSVLYAGEEYSVEWRLVARRISDGVTDFGLASTSVCTVSGGCGPPGPLP